MKKIIVALVLVIAIGGYAFWTSAQNNTPAFATTSTTDTSGSATSIPSETANPNATGLTDNTNSTNSDSTGTASTGQYKDGIYTGSVADAFYGNLQVRATISGGKLINVTFVQYPNDQSESVDVNTRSNPILKSEAIAAQSAKINIVSGATQSSEAFRQSLASALQQAQS